MGRSCSPARFWQNLTRTKTLDENLMKTQLRRCLSTPQLILFGFGQMIGAGIYALTGEVMRSQAGPSTFIAYFAAGLISILSALCYAEFGARVPRAGSSFTFAYVTIGEFIAFIIGWNIILEHAIITAATARAWSSTIDLLANYAISNFTINHLGGYNVGGHMNHVDFIAPGLILLLGILVIVGARETMGFASCIAVINFFVLSIIAVTCFAVADVNNFKNEDHGGLTPHGVGGLLSGIATLIYAYSGYDGITIAAEETEDPAKALPIANVSVMVTVIIFFTVLSLGLAFATPYYLVDPNAAFSVAFARLDMKWAEYVVSVGALIAITGICLGNVFSVSRTAFAMARDGLIFEFIAYVNPKTQTPIFSIAIFVGLAGFLAFILDVAALAEFVSIGTLIAVSLVSTSVVVLRYSKPIVKSYALESPGDADTSRLVESSPAGKLKPQYENTPFLRNLQPGKAVSVSLGLLYIPMCAVGILIKYTADGPFKTWALILGIILVVIVVMLFVVIVMHQIDEDIPTFKMPLVPFLPVFSMFLNVILLMQLSPSAWLRFLIWMIFGFIIYFGYGMWHSKEKTDDVPLSESSNNKSYKATESSDDKDENDEPNEKST